MQCNRSFADASPASLLISCSAARAIRFALFLSLVLIMCVLCSGMQDVMVPQSNPVIGIIPKVGPPTTTVSVTGSGFDPYAAVDIYFDLTDMLLVVTNGAGAFGGPSLQGGIAIQVPASALPGNHWITAVERYGIKAAQKSFMVRTDWAQFRFKPDHKGVNPYENVLSPANVGSLNLHWSYLTSRFYSFTSSAAVANDVLYVGSWDKNLYALNATTGALLWKYTTGHVVDISSPAVANGVVYVGSGDGNLYALNASTGFLLWKFQTGNGVESSPAVANGVVYVGSGDGNLYALNASTGFLLWKFQTGWKVESSPAVANGIVYIGSWDHNVYALNATTGALLWKYTTGYWVDISSPAVANGVVYVGSLDGRLYSLNATTGALLWKYDTGDWLDLSSPAVTNGVVYVASKNGHLYSLNATTGAELWQYPAGGISSPAVGNGVVYLGSVDGNLYALNATTGAFLWKYSTGRIDFSSPAVANGMVYIGSADGKLHAFGLPSDQMAKDFGPPERPDPMLLVPDYSLQPSTTRMPSDSR